MIHSIKHLVVAAALLTPLSGALAAEMDMQTATVSLSGINVMAPEAEAAVRHRVVVAARRVCGTADATDMQGMRDMERCRVEALRDAMPRLHAALSSARARASFAQANTVLVAHR